MVVAGVTVSNPKTKVTGSWQVSSDEDWLLENLNAKMSADGVVCL